MNIKTGDNVKIITGKDKGKTGKVLQVFVARDRVSVEGRNLLIKHLRPSRSGEKGQRVEFPAPLHVSNVALICPKCGSVARIGFNKPAGGKKTRSCRKCKQVID